MNYLTLLFVCAKLSGEESFETLKSEEEKYEMMNNTLQFSQQGPEEHSASIFSLQVMGLQQGLLSQLGCNYVTLRYKLFCFLEKLPQNHSRSPRSRQ